MNNKMLEKTVHFFNVDLADIPTWECPNISEAAVRTCTATQSFLKMQQHSQECTCTVVSFQPATFNFIGKRRDAGTYSFLLVLRNFLGTLLLRKTSCEVFLKEELYEKWRTDVHIIIKRYREVDSFFMKQTLRRKVYL